MKAEPIGGGCHVLVDHVHTFGTDAILLADFAAPGATETACDLCTGCGIIPMLWAKHRSVAAATGVELQPEAAALFRQTVEENNMQGYITALQGDVKALQGLLPFGSFDLVTCNPPYKAVGAGLQNADPAVLLARHEVGCTLQDVVAAAAKLLRFGGRFCLCHRPERLADIFCTMRAYRIEPKCLRTVAKTAGNAPWLVLVEGRLGGRSGMRIAPTLYVEGANGDFSPEMQQIYGSYKFGR